MHEYSLVQSLVQRVEEEGRRRGALAIHGVKVSLGELAGVDPDLFRTAYETFREGTACARASLELVTVPASWICPSCGRTFGHGEALSCGPCGQPAVMSPDGDALVLEAIEMEVP